MKITVNAPAKINLYLDILGRREDGYHDVEMVMQTVSLCDTVTVTRTKHGNINLTCSTPIPGPVERNTAYLAAQAFFEYANICNLGIDIHIRKRIPICAGLAGGSADAAAVLNALNRLFATNFSKDELAALGEKIGADVPFCVHGGTMLATGTGTTLEALPPMPKCYFVIVKPNIAISTRAAYEASDASASRQHLSSRGVISAITAKDLQGVAMSLYNRFEEVLALEKIEKIKFLLTQHDALNASMSGSGSAVFGIFDNEVQATKCKEALSSHYDEVFLAEPVCFV